MADTNSVQQELLALDWQDFSTYPKKGSPLMIHAEGFDTKERVWKHLFFNIEEFDPMNFPDENITKILNKHHCKWKFQWLAPKNK